MGCLTRTSHTNLPRLGFIHYEVGTNQAGQQILMDMTTGMSMMARIVGLVGMDGR
jgi:hypothetical protein